MKTPSYTDNIKFPSPKKEVPITDVINHIRDNVSIPVIASSGADCVEHFSEVFEKTKAEAALAAGIFHREEIPIEAVKEHMRDEGIETR
jgi:glutamine amidotransferase/cyclase